MKNNSKKEVSLIYLIICAQNHTMACPSFHNGLTSQPKYSIISKVNCQRQKMRFYLKPKSKKKESENKKQK